MIAAITELSRFYQKAGPRAGLTLEVGKAVRAHLDAAEKALADVTQGNNIGSKDVPARGRLEAGSSDESLMQGLFVSAAAGQ